MTSEVGARVLQQLGGSKFLVMTGARIMRLPNGLAIQLPRPAKDRIRNVQIELRSNDTYTVTFWRPGRGLIAHHIKQVDGIYADQLETLFSETTGLATRL